MPGLKPRHFATITGMELLTGPAQQLRHESSGGASMETDYSLLVDGGWTAQ